MAVIQILGGFVLLFVGGEFVVRGAVALANRFGVSPLVIGLTACSAYASNGGTFKPIDYRIEKPAGPAR